MGPIKKSTGLLKFLWARLKISVLYKFIPYDLSSYKSNDGSF